MAEATSPDRFEFNLPLYELAFQTTPVGMSYVTMDRRVVMCNPALCKFLGRDLADIRSIGISELTHPDDLHLHDHLHRKLLAGEIDRYALDKRYLHKDGRSLWAHLEVVVVRDELGVRRMLLSQVVDIGERVAQAELLRWHATHDQLTRLANRQTLYEKLDTSLARAAPEAPVGVLFIDIDGFKAVNDNHGHLMGDLLLQKMASRLLDALTPEDMAARLGGDEFVVVVDNVCESSDLIALATRIHAALAGSHPDMHPELAGLTASIGIASASEGSAKALLQQADAAMYAAKRSGPGRTLHAE